tara:strand:- start:34 stop:1059 length:1026 start_codon:yes stop_codon:yes gene_type:complete
MKKIINIHSPGTQWRVFEKEKLNKHFGTIVDVKAGDFIETSKIIKDHDLSKDCWVYWRIDSDSMKSQDYTNILKQRELLEDFSMINDPKNYLYSHAKEVAFGRWASDKIRCPKFEVIESAEDIVLEYPYLLRLNNEVTGQCSYLIRNEEDLNRCFPLLEQDFAKASLAKSFTKKIAVEFIDATVEGGKYNLSYRIIVAGDEVITGYARLSEATDWVAITGKFTESMGPDFIKYQARCQKIMTDKKDLIVASVKSLGLNLQGVDVIENQSGELIFLECQPGFSTGYSSWPKPFYNPHYPELVNFILQNQRDFMIKSPMYYYNWLNKEKLFEEVFKNIKKEVN